MNRSIRTAFLAGWVGIASCASLPDIPRDTCGNHIVEANEDCDTVGDSVAKTVCRPAGSPGQCRLDCTLKDGTGPSCPTGWSCGLDAICRAATGQFVALPTQLKSDATSLALYDYDGDGLKDIRSRGASSVQVFYSDVHGASGQSFTIPSIEARPASGLLSTGTSNDIALVANGAIAVWRGNANRTMSPTPYPTIPLPGDPLRFIPVQSVGPIPPETTVAPGAQILVFSDSKLPGLDTRRRPELC